jgi:hypothetical protein
MMYSISTNKLTSRWLDSMQPGQGSGYIQYEARIRKWLYTV